MESNLVHTQEYENYRKIMAYGRSPEVVKAFKEVLGAEAPMYISKCDYSSAIKSCSACMFAQVYLQCSLTSGDIEIELRPSDRACLYCSAP